MAEQLNGNQIPNNDSESTKSDYKEIHPEPGTTVLAPPPDYAEIEGARNTSNNGLLPPSYPGDLKSFGGSPPSCAAMYTIAGDIRGMAPSYCPPTSPNNQGASLHLNIPPQPVNNMYPGFTPSVKYPEQASDPPCYYITVFCCWLAFGVLAYIINIQYQWVVQMNYDQSAASNYRLAIFFEVIAFKVGMLIIIAVMEAYCS